MRRAAVQRGVQQGLLDDAVDGRRTLAHVEPLAHADRHVDRPRIRAGEVVERGDEADGLERRRDPPANRADTGAP